jgi:hypothetical protein
MTASLATDQCRVSVPAASDESELVRADSFRGFCPLCSAPSQGSAAELRCHSRCGVAAGARAWLPPWGPRKRRRAVFASAWHILQPRVPASPQPWVIWGGKIRHHCSAELVADARAMRATSAVRRHLEHRIDLNQRIPSASLDYPCMAIRMRTGCPCRPSSSAHKQSPGTQRGTASNTSRKLGMYRPDLNGGGH